MASINIGGRNLDRIIRHFGPTSLSDNILARSSAVFSRTFGLVALQNRSNKYTGAPVKKTKKKHTFTYTYISINFKALFKELF